MSEATVHVPVLVEPVLELLDPRPGESALDVTLGAGGHSVRIARAIGPDGLLVGVDRDAQILETARARLEGLGDDAPKLVFVHGNFADALAERPSFPGRGFDVVIADLGVSSLQLDDPGRGFSFRKDGPLDMRMDASRGQSARDFIQETTAEELADVIYEYGEERKSRSVARAIKRALERGPITTTRELADVVRSVVPRGGRDGFDPATRTFQAIRIAVNQEFDALDRFLDRVIGILAPNGRCAVISFHSLEDRRVKTALRAFDAQGEIEVLTPKPVGPTAEETSVNPRSRSAKLRAFRRRS